MRILKLTLCGLVLAVLCGCRQVAPPASLAREAESATPTPTSAAVSAAGRVLPDLPGDLKLEEHLLLVAPGVEPLTFKPAEGTQEEILARHASVRGLDSSPYADGGIISIDGRSRRTIGLNGTLFSAVEISHNPTQTIVTEPWGKREVRVMQGDEVIYAIQAGHSSPFASFQGLWAYDEHWVLEIAYVVASLSPDSNTVSSDIKGKIVDTSMLLNDKYGYDEAFGFQLIAGRPFYFFKRAGSIWISYADQELDLGYTEIPHYRCCSGGELNPLKSETMVAFFAQRDAVWYYVELGVF